MKKAFLLFTALFLLNGCSTTSVDYVGNTYPPTTSADVYYSKQDIHQSYTVMGKMIMSAEEGTTSQQLQQQILTTAESKGADGVLITSFKKVNVGANTDYMGEDFGWDDIGIGGFWEGFGPGAATTEYIQDLQIIAFFLKYNAAPAAVPPAQVPVPPVQVEGSLG